MSSNSNQNDLKVTLEEELPRSHRECEHKALYFGSGDYYLFCEECGRSWVMDHCYPNNVGESYHLSGERRVCLKILN